MVVVMVVMAAFAIVALRCPGSSGAYSIVSHFSGIVLGGFGREHRATGRPESFDEFLKVFSRRAECRGKAVETLEFRHASVDDLVVQPHFVGR